MHSFTPHRLRRSSEKLIKETNGLVLNSGRHYDLMAWLLDPILFRGKLRTMRIRVADLAHMQPGEKVLDVGCGTGTLAIEVQKQVGQAGYVAGIDPGSQQIATASAKAARRNVSIDFQVGMIERLPFSDQTFDVVFSTLMMHHLPDSLKSQGLSEIVRVLKPGGRLIIADFTSKKDRQGRAARLHAGGSNLQKLATLVKDAGFSRVETEEIQPSRFSAFPGAGIVSAHKS